MKGVIMSCMKVVSRHSGGTEENHEIICKVIGILAENRTRHLLNVNQERYRLSYLDQCQLFEPCNEP
jgi:hypothetical protein